MRWTVRTGDIDLGVFPSEESAESWAEQIAHYLKYEIVSIEDALPTVVPVPLSQ